MTKPILSLPQYIIDDLVTRALREDLGRGGDITTSALVPSDRIWSGQMVMREDGILAGIDLAKASFLALDPDLSFESVKADGVLCSRGEVVARIQGKATAILSAERTALNFLTHLSGIASLTHKYIEAVKGTKAQICCTRKTHAGLRALEKYAVRAGGGRNHRFGLDDAVLIKDNHIAVAGDIRSAVKSVRSSIGHMVKVEVEVDTLDQLAQLLDMPVDVVLLDNMNPDELQRAVQMVSGQFLTEASGGVTLAHVAAIAASGVDMISIGALTHSAPALDIALDEI
ncbi:MAG: carboxylating nicotinate-nucleotide diphosphorylase [Proteobacteria bacterium]|jgi:nicotinate-nucleotide pyrophosphorylase (carboxylating)|nr:carboxylating nicotinate-nucleotide diphosphorylase [Alphaproteobacteria bacterium]NCC03711.1 carboxylating nicotinate-nucleotide diphosphorylase [Pseudomonadota bacterium]